MPHRNRTDLERLTTWASMVVYVVGLVVAFMIGLVLLAFCAA